MMMGISDSTIRWVDFRFEARLTLKHMYVLVQPQGQGPVAIIDDHSLSVDLALLSHGHLNGG
jgi:hypothetical protein